MTIETLGKISIATLVCVAICIVILLYIYYEVTRKK